MNIELWERNYRSSCLQIFFKIGVFKNCANFTGKHLCVSLFSIKLQIWRLANLLRRDSKQVPWERNYRRSRSQLFFKKGVLKKIRKFYRKIPVLASPFNKVADLKTCNFVKNRLQHRCFPVKFEKFLRTFLLQNTSGGHFWN